ncbi:MAG: acyl-CoA dehydrogenase family protein [Planctomycetaceae bacterium]|jgi:alkylation response protein AidB-like acyl-CoA dehydrogenase|nr:acyl-CoA dehydrogenase family protein [Planctomycetaceae bacterium]
MPNFFTDNQDIQFLFDYFDLKELAALQERETPNGDADYAPADVDDAVDNYRRVLEIVGEIAAETLAPNAEQIDLKGNTHNADDGTVTYHPLVRQNFDRLAQADMMGFTVPRKYGGLNCPILIYTMATEIVSRGDVSFMNMFGLQGIADTIYAFASDEIKDEYLPKFASGEVTGAMVLTEPDAGSDLQAVRLRADYSAATAGRAEGWVLNGVKRFITNGCGEVLLVLARSEHDIKDGRGLSLFLCERSSAVKVRCLEKKLGIHGSPTCELVFDNTPAKLIGERKLGLITYVLALMNGARLGIAAQSLGVAEAAYRLARTYAHTREQFGAPIERLPPVAEMVIDMQVRIEAMRALTYETARVCDLENNINRLLERNADALSDEEKKQLKKDSRTYKRLNAMLTPFSKYYGSEGAIKVSTDAIQVLGGSGYCKDYPAERYYRDARITSIYEGTSQLQVVAAIKGITSGVLFTYLETFESKNFSDASLEALKQTLIKGREQIQSAVEFVKQQSGAYVDLVARQLVDAAIAVLAGHYFLSQASPSVAGACPAVERKKRVAEHFITKNVPVIECLTALVKSGHTAVLTDYETLAGPVPAA